MVRAVDKRPGADAFGRLSKSFTVGAVGLDLTVTLTSSVEPSVYVNVAGTVAVVPAGTATNSDLATKRVLVVPVNAPDI
ncbi:Uncharacterised protein [Streptococcus pneumoniae]|nr:Uncharacterised protein [Streptococcus pneumoniae]CJY74524.1 Uncharacterised protein [Streptococcus pneumoniae]